MPGPCMTLQQLQAYIPGSCPLQESGPRSRFYPVNCSATDAIAVRCSEISVSQRLSRFGAIDNISSFVQDLFHKSPGLVLRGLLASLDNSDLMIDDEVGTSPAINGKARLSPITHSVWKSGFCGRGIATYNIFDGEIGLSGLLERDSILIDLSPSCIFCVHLCCRG